MSVGCTVYVTSLLTQDHEGQFLRPIKRSDNVATYFYHFIVRNPERDLKVIFSKNCTKRYIASLVVFLTFLISWKFTAQIPNRPEFPPGTDIRSCMAFGSRTTPNVQWFVFRNEPTMIEWLKSMGGTVSYGWV